MHRSVSHRHKLFHPNFGGVPVAPCWGQPAYKPYAIQPWNYFRRIPTYVITVPKRYGQPRRWTDGQTSHCGITALCISSWGKNRAKNYRSPHLLNLSQSYLSVGCESNTLTENHIMGCKNITRCRAIAKLTAWCALYIGYSTLILFTPVHTTLCRLDSERIWADCIQSIDQRSYVDFERSQ